MPESIDKPVKANVFAAGAVLWRPGRTPDAPLEVAMVHRQRYGDWSFPKGKLDPGEIPVVAAVREIEEETGFRSVLGRSLGSVTYPITGHRKLKRVDYWTARCGDGEFVPNDEVDELRWSTVGEAFDQLSYPMDRSVLRRFRAYPADTRTVLVVRHARAGSRKKYRGDDTKRPLDKTGRAQAQALVPLLSAFGARSVTSADRVRCVSTVQPCADRLGVTVTVDPVFSEESYAEDRDRTHKKILDIAANQNSPVVCSQGKVIPHMLQWWAERDGVAIPPNRNRKGSVWVLSLHRDRLVAVDHIDSALPVERN